MIWAVAMVAGLRPEKNHRMLLDAAVAVADIVPNVRFLIVGDGAQRESLEMYARAMRVEENVEFLGKRADIPDVLRAVDLVVLSSNSEGLPNVLLEAGAAGRACVCTDAGDSARVVKDGKTGYVVACGDKEMFARRIVEDVRDERLRFRMEEAAMEYVRPTFSIEAMGGRVMAAYRNGIEQTRSRSKVARA